MSGLPHTARLKAWTAAPVAMAVWVSSRFGNVRILAF